jgi:hypothetical protein
MGLKRKDNLLADLQVQENLDVVLPPPMLIVHIP